MYWNNQKEWECNNILIWILSFDYEKKHHSIKTLHVDETDEWLLQRSEFQKWWNERNTIYILWCHDLQESEKSMLASIFHTVSSDYADWKQILDHKLFEKRCKKSICYCNLSVLWLLKLEKSVIYSYSRKYFQTDCNNKISYLEINFKLISQILCTR